MRWVLRLLGLATLFALPCFWLSRPWQHALGAIATTVLSWFHIDVEMSDVQVMAPFDLGIYLAMCLAGTRAPAVARRRAIEGGAPLMVALEIVTVVAAVAVFYALHGAQDPNSQSVRVVQYVLEFVPWASAVTVWLVMLGAWELPAGLLAPPAGARDPGRPAALR